jgi:hypothetical protein
MTRRAVSVGFYGSDPMCKEAFDDERTLQAVMRLLLEVDRARGVVRTGTRPTYNLFLLLRAPV